MNPIKRAILEYGAKQYRVAKWANMSETRLSRIATGRLSPTDAEVSKLAEFLGCDPAALRTAPPLNAATKTTVRS